MNRRLGLLTAAVAVLLLAAAAPAFAARTADTGVPYGLAAATARLQAARQHDERRVQGLEPQQAGQAQ